MNEQIVRLDKFSKRIFWTFDEICFQFEGDSSSGFVCVRFNVPELVKLVKLGAFEFQAFSQFETHEGSKHFLLCSPEAAIQTKTNKVVSIYSAFYIIVTCDNSISILKVTSLKTPNWNNFTCPVFVINVGLLNILEQTWVELRGKLKKNFPTREWEIIERW